MSSYGNRGNPAQRLHDLLERLLAIPGKGNAGDAWAQVLGTEDAAELLQSFGAVVALPAEIRTWWPTLTARDEDVHVHEKAVKGVEQTFRSQALHGGLEAYKKSINSTVMQGLETAAGAIRRAGGADPELDQEALEKLLQQVHDLTDEVHASGDLDPELKNFALTHLLAIERAIRLLQVQGAQAAEAEISRFLGDLVVAHQTGEEEIIEFVSDSTSIGGRIWSVLSRLATIVDVAQAPALIEGTLKAITGGS